MWKWHKDYEFLGEVFRRKNLHGMSAFTREQSYNTTPQSQPTLEWTWNTFWFFNIYSWFIPFAKLDQPSQEDELFWVSDFPKRCTRQLSYKIFKDPRIIATWHEGSNLGFWAKALKQMFRFKVNLQLSCLETWLRLRAQTHHKTVTFGCWSICVVQ